MIRIKKITGLVLFLIFTSFLSAQTVSKSFDLTQEGAMQLVKQANLEAQKLNKNVSIAVLNSSGVTLLLLKGDNVGPHNTEASRRKAYTSLSTKTPSYILMQNAEKSTDAKNLNTLPELLLLGGGTPIFKDGILVGGIGISGGGGGENDHNIAVKAAENSGFKITP
ncbi:heme-binding protein [Kaistella jeonii]|uniref:heme-binding protein n=1 Tax=Kaistella jeonii TaxID=266749 RepID=UPI00068CEA84|nr:heme-binding protein [Kaistella jeonii]SFB78561.1 Uncharacterized conserved protein GlcG, DUF336 family [Kaistella jeonii]VEI96321.1 Uncharacterized conserved protein [Kaistella jeonii]